jgi:predicted nucleotide-binding protein (sugar kinase/HSP70/actin superfamily)
VAAGRSSGKEIIKNQTKNSQTTKCGGRIQMALRVGIPRALFYYYYYPQWETFFWELGADTVLSSPTHKGIIEAGVRAAVDEACLPVKVYYGHVLELAAKVDYLFLPRLVSVEHKSYICPKFMGLPDMIKSSLPKLPPIIDLCVDRSRDDRQFKRDLYRVGRIFTNNHWKIKRAVEASEAMLADYRHLLQAGCLPAEALEKLYPGCPPEAGEVNGSLPAQGAEPVWETESARGAGVAPGDQGAQGVKDALSLGEARKAETASCFEAVGLKKASVLNVSRGSSSRNRVPAAAAAAADAHPITIGLLGHGYTIYDEYISRQTIRKLREMGVNVVTQDLLSPEAIEIGASRLPKRMFWSLGKQILGGAYHFFEQRNVDGIVHLACFGCGPDSLVAELVEIEAHRRKDLPFMMLTVDEHTGEAGIITRLEAFIDMIRRQRMAYLWQEVPI